MTRFIFLLLLLPINILNSQTLSPYIHIDQFGYLPSSSKVAVLSNPQVGYNASESYAPGATIELRDALTDNVIYAAAPSIWNGGATHDSSGDSGWWFDFSSIEEIGSYYIYDPTNDERSDVFQIGLNAYHDVLKAAGRMFFYNRCNAPKNMPYAEAAWTDGTNFLNPLQDASCRFFLDQSNASLEKDLSGGWFDAGDYNKYVTFAHSAVHNLLWAYEENPQAFDDDWNIPESGNGIPDVLDELKWELDWLLKMCNPDGSTHIKMGTIGFGDNTESPPSANTDPRVYGATCTSASIAVASMFAHASKVFAPWDANYATTLELEAELAWNYVETFLPNGLETECDDGTISAGDADWDEAFQKEALLTAAAHLFELTDDSVYGTYIVNHLVDAEFMTTNSWNPYRIPVYDALLMYTEHPNADSGTSNTIRSNFATDASNNWNGYYGFNADDLYRAFMPNWSYHWGSNNPKAGYAILNELLVNYNLNPASASDYLEKSVEQLHYFHGVNPLGIVYLSNMYNQGGGRCINELYHTWFYDGTDWDNALTSTYGPPPGYLTGGPNATFSVGTISPPSGQPDQKSYLDFNTGWPDSSWEISEPAIYYQATYIRHLANFVDETISTSTQVALSPECIEVLMDANNNYFTIKGTLSSYDIMIVNSIGQIVQTINSVTTEEVVDISTLGTGIYFIVINSKTHNALQLKKIVKS